VGQPIVEDDRWTSDDRAIALEAAVLRAVKRGASSIHEIAHGVRVSVYMFEPAMGELQKALAKLESKEYLSTQNGAYSYN
jgi:hypothetical protein